MTPAFVCIIMGFSLFGMFGKNFRFINVALIVEPESRMMVVGQSLTEI